MEKVQTVLFDFDGTLADTSRGIYNSIRYALGEAGIPVGDESRLREFIGPPLYESFETVYGVDPDEASRLVDLYRVYYGKSGVFECDLYPGVSELLEVLSSSRTSGGPQSLAIVSSKPLHFLKVVLPHLGIDSCFDAVVGPELKNKNSDKSFLIDRALKTLGVPADHAAAMVGDRFYDMEGAVRAGITAIGVTWGFGPAEELTASGAEALAATPRELTGVLGAARK